MNHLLIFARDEADASAFQEVHQTDLAGDDFTHTILRNPRAFGSYATHANGLLETLRRSSTTSVLGIVHADTRWPSGDLQRMFDAAREPAIVGLVGITLSREYVWCTHPGCETKTISTLDACSIFLPVDASALRFDELTFLGFHCAAEDLCLQGASLGIPIRVVPSGASHIGQTGADPAWQAEYWSYRHELGRKWRHVPFQTT